MALTNERTRTYTAGAALSAFRRVKMDSTADQVVHADAADGDAWIGWTTQAYSSGDPATIVMRDGGLTAKVESAGAITADAIIFPADAGKVTATASRQSPVGRARSASAASGQIVEMQTLEVLGETKILTVLLSASGDTVIPKPANKLRIADWWVVARDTNASNVKLKRNANDICTAIAKGVTNDTRVQGTTLVAAEDEVDPADVLYANNSGATAVEVYVLAYIIG